MVNFFRATTRLNQSFQSFIAKWLSETELTEGYFEVLRCLKQLSLIEDVDTGLEGEFDDLQIYYYYNLYIRGL